jgi:hypothetical protein
MPRIWPYLENLTNKDQQKYYVRPIVLSHSDILTNLFLLFNYGTLQMRIVVSRE